VYGVKPISALLQKRLIMSSFQNGIYRLK